MMIMTFMVKPTWIGEVGNKESMYGRSVNGIYHVSYNDNNLFDNPNIKTKKCFM